MIELYKQAVRVLEMRHTSLTLEMSNWLETAQKIARRIIRILEEKEFGYSDAFKARLLLKHKKALEQLIKAMWFLSDSPSVPIQNKQISSDNF